MYVSPINMALLRSYGAIVELEVPGVEAAPSVLLHVSQMDHKPVCGGEG